MKLINAVSYTRYSSDKQQRSSITAQLKDIHEFAEKNHIRIIEDYIDEAQSGTNDRRINFQRMIRDAPNGEFQLVLVHRMDRWARNVEDAMTYRKRLKLFGVQLIGVLDFHDDASPEGSFFNLINMGLAEMQSKKIARDCFNGLKVHARDGEHVGGIPPLGYKRGADKRFLEIDEKGAEAVRIIFQMAVDGAGYRRIQTHLNNLGYTTQRGKPFSTHFYEILSNRKYIGEYVYNRASGKSGFGTRNNHKNKPESEIIRIPGGVPQIISEELFNKVQKLLNDRRQGEQKWKKNSKYLLTGLMECYCGRSMSGSFGYSGREKRPWLSYVCNGKNHGEKRCPLSALPMLHMDAYIRAIIQNVLLNPEFATMVTKLIASNYKNQLDGYLEKQKEQEKIVQAIQQEIEVLEKELSTTKFAFDYLKQKLGEKQVERERAENSLIITEQAMRQSPTIQKRAIANQIRHWKKLWKHRQLEIERDILYKFISRIIHSPETITIEVNLSSYLSDWNGTPITFCFREARENIAHPKKHHLQKLEMGELDIV